MNITFKRGESINDLFRHHPGGDGGLTGTERKEEAYLLKLKEGLAEEKKAKLATKKKKSVKKEKEVRPAKRPVIRFCSRCSIVPLEYKRKRCDGCRQELRKESQQKGTAVKLARVAKGFCYVCGIKREILSKRKCQICRDKHNK